MDKLVLDERIWELRVSLLRIAGGMLRHTQNAEDAVSAAILIAYQRLDTLRDDDSLRPWLSKITVRCCYELERKARRERPSETLPRPSLFVSDTGDTLYDMLENMPKAMGRVLLLYYYEGFSVAEIADMLHMSHAAVAMRMSRGRKRLKEMLIKESLYREGGNDRE